MKQRRSFESLGRVLAVDPRSRRAAWSYFKDGQLEDCQVRTFRRESVSARVERDIVPYLGDLLDLHAPHALLIPRIAGAGSRRRSKHSAAAIRGVVRAALERGIAVHVVGTDTVKDALSQLNASPIRNNQEINELVLGHFPELTMMVPAPREKIWQPEQYFAPLFNTVAMYLAWEHRLSPIGT